MNRPAWRVLLAAGALAALAGCAGPTVNPGPSATPTVTPTATATPTPSVDPSPTARPANLPNPGLTPGKVMTTDLNIICGQPTKLRRDVTQKTKDRIYASYNVTVHTPATYQIDHLIPLELGGDNTDSNLWPEPADPKPGFHQKDQLEDTLHAAVCDKHTVTIEVAQAAIATDWVAAYQQYVKP